MRMLGAPMGALGTQDRRDPEDAPAVRPRELGLLFAVALLVRLAALVAFDAAGEARGAQTWYWGHETACVAQAIAEGRGVADPWCQGTGATAWLTPVYPSIVAACLRLFGGVGAASATALFTIHALVSAATCLALVTFGRVLGRPRAGRLAGWVFAFYPGAIWNSARVVWDTTFVAAALLLFLTVVVASSRPLGSRRALGLGLAYGALLLLNPAPASSAPVVVLYLCRGLPWRAALARSGTFLGAAALVCLPWALRNQVVLGTFSLRSNLGVELRVGNNDLADGRHKTEYHPSDTPRELERYRELGEVGYSRWSQERALEWIGAHRARFAALTLRRAQIFWIGESPRRDPRVDHETGITAAEDPKSWIKWVQHMATGLVGLAGMLVLAWRSREGLLLAGVLLLFPLPYYVTHVSERYRFPIDPLLVFLAAALVLTLLRGPGRERELSRVA